MKEQKDFKPIDFLTVTKAGNIVITDPVTGAEVFCLRHDDKTFVNTVNKEVMTIDEIGKALILRIKAAYEIENIIEAKKAELKSAKKANQFCMNCGTPLKPGDKFCMNCGKAVGK